MLTRKLNMEYLILSHIKNTTFIPTVRQAHLILMW